MQPATGVLLSEFTQPHQLREAIRRADVRHGEAVRVNISGIRIPKPTAVQAGESVPIRFCEIGDLTVTQKPRRNPRRIPPKVRRQDVRLCGADRLRNLKPGYYTLQNVTLYANGSVELGIHADSKIVVEEYDEELEACPF